MNNAVWVGAAGDDARTAAGDLGVSRASVSVAARRRASWRSPRDDRSESAVALWGSLTGEAPDEYPVATDEERHVLLATLSYVRGVSYYIDAALGLALLSFTGTLVAARYLGRGRGRR